MNPTLDEFMASSEYRCGFASNSYVRFFGFDALYVRVGPRYIDGRRLEKVIDLASMEAKKPGKGAFRSLIFVLRAKYPTYGIYVENVLTTQFAEGLDRMGFRKIIVGDGAGPPSFFLSAKEKVS